MSDVTQILIAIDAGDSLAAEQLLPLVYEELRRLAAARMAQEKPGQTLDATGLVHEAWLRLAANVSPRDAPAAWNGRRHFFAAAAEAMRRILVEKARSKRRHKRGGELKRLPLNDVEAISHDSAMALAVHELLDRLAKRSPRRAELVKLRIFGGFTQKEAAESLGIAISTADDDWAFARAWLQREWDRGEEI